MKKLVLFSFLFLSVFAFSQAPEGINYQAVIRNSTGNLVASTTVAIRVQVRQTTATGAVIYQERHSVFTSAQGLINMVIGAGTPQVGTFNGINWGNGPYFVNLAVDLANGVNYQDYGTQQLMSVPYALYAKSSGNQLNQWRYGNIAPPSTLGTFGDFYLDVITGNVYYKNSGTAWVLTGNIKGPVGPTGLQGPAGAAGAQGQQGIQGATGATGAQGQIGLTGPQGAQGIQGPAGTTGATGLTGAQGLQGVAGTNGLNALIKTTTEAAGVNCTNGGTKIETGLDANGNGVLDASEVNASQTKYVCNGSVGGNLGGFGFNANHGYLNLANDTFFVANTNRLVEVILQGGNGGSGGYAGGCPGGSSWSGGAGGSGAGIRFLLNISTGDTIHIDLGENGIDGCGACVYTGICTCCFSGQAGTSGSSSRISINSSNFQNYIFEAQGGGAGGAGLFQGTGGIGGAGGNGSLIYGSQYQNVGAFILDPNLNGQGAAVILRW